jgi:hypothetical protein
MNLEPAPRLSKSIFLVIDAVLLLTAFLIVYFNTKNPYAPLPFVSAILCVVLAAIIGLIPFLIDYAADSAEYVQAERERVSDQVQRLHAAGESLARAAAQIKAVEEAVHKTAHAAENLPYRMQEKLAEFNETLAQQEESDREALESELVELRAANSTQLKAVAEKIASAVADLTALESATRKHLAAAEAALSKGQGAAADTTAQFEARLKAALSQLDTRLAALAHAGNSPMLAAPVAAAATDDGGQRPPQVDPSPVVASAPAAEAPTASEEPKPKKPRAPRKPKTEEAVAAADAANSSGEPVLADTPAVASPTSHQEPAVESTRSEHVESAGREPVESALGDLVESAASSDGATRLLATAYIGIGNKLYIRGNGPGLSWDKGEPMQFVSIGKWGWATNSATAPISCKLYKNDESEALTGAVTLEPGRHVEITALF